MENIWRIGEVQQNCQRANTVSIRKKKINRNKTFYFLNLTLTSGGKFWNQHDLFSELVYGIECMHGKLVDGRKLAGSLRMWKDMLRIKNDLGEVV